MGTFRSIVNGNDKQDYCAGPYFVCYRQKLSRQTIVLRDIPLGRGDKKVLPKPSGWHRSRRAF